uniref:Uncharacterized protein n=1 Tax=Rhizophora mucronata TaxID=61149 RepID=A0A2P2KHW5_RHIMU
MPFLLSSNLVVSLFFFFFWVPDANAHFADKFHVKCALTKTLNQLRRFVDKVL